MSNPTPADFKQLRKRFFDGSDHFMRGSAIHGKSWSSHATRVENISITDPWAFDDEQVRLLLLRSFPNMNTERETEEQRRRLRTWMLIIQWYFREGVTANRIVLRLNNMRFKGVQTKGAEAKRWRMPSGVFGMPPLDCAQQVNREPIPEGDQRILSRKYLLVNRLTLFCNK